MPGSKLQIRPRDLATWTDGKGNVVIKLYIMFPFYNIAKPFIAKAKFIKA